ncbi:conserved hypothetical protein [Mesorhizobium sp. ORS 3359]|nr:conserved hypothetical protein [Mesorhizobium sp. ORS 3359]
MILPTCCRNRCSASASRWLVNLLAPVGDGLAFVERPAPVDPTIRYVNTCIKVVVPLAGIEPALLAELDFESSASTNSAIGAQAGRPGWARTIRADGCSSTGLLRICPRNRRHPPPFGLVATQTLCGAENLSRQAKR